MTDYESVRSDWWKLLNWHLKINGTRPTGNRQTRGEVWTEKEFAQACNVGDPNTPERGTRTVYDWLNTRKRQLPSRYFNAIEKALFGDNSEYAAWQIDLRIAFKLAKEAKADSSKDAIHARPAADDEFAQGGSREQILASKESRHTRALAHELERRELKLTVPEAPAIIGSNRPLSYLWGRRHDATGYGSAGRILEELIEIGRLPLEGGRTEITEEKLTVMTDVLHGVATSELTKVGQIDLIAVSSSLLRLGRCDPRLHTRWRSYEDWLMQRATSPESVFIRSEIRDRTVREMLERQILELRNLQDVTKHVHAEGRAARLDPKSALNLDVPHLALWFIAIEMARLNAQGEPEKVVALYRSAAKAIIERYKYLNVSAISLKLFREPNADIDIKTCAAHVYLGVSNAYVLLASKESENERRKTIMRAREFIKRAFESYLFVTPPWLHGLASLNATRYVLESLYGSYEQARAARQEMELQLRACGDLTAIKKLPLVGENDHARLLRFLVTLQ